LAILAAGGFWVWRSLSRDSVQGYRSPFGSHPAGPLAGQRPNRAQTKGIKMKHTETRIYKQSMELVAYAKSVVERLPRGYGFLADQLRRAATSVALNYAEGCGKQHLKDRRRFFIQARGSANVASVPGLGKEAMNKSVFALDRVAQQCGHCGCRKRIRSHRNALAL